MTTKAQQETTQETCRAIRGCTEPATGTALSYFWLGYVPACTNHRTTNPKENHPA